MDFDKFEANGNINNPKQITNECNRYFAKNIGLFSQQYYTIKGFSHYLKSSQFSSTCYFKPTDENEIIKIIGKLGSNKIPGYDNNLTDLINT